MRGRSLEGAPSYSWDVIPRRSELCRPSRTSNTVTYGPVEGVIVMAQGKPLQLNWMSGNGGLDADWERMEVMG